MRNSMNRIIALLTSLLLATPFALHAEEAPAAPSTESNCTNGVDDDGDGLADCGDSDCALDPSCAPAEEATEEPADPAPEEDTEAPVEEDTEAPAVEEEPADPAPVEDTEAPAVEEPADPAPVEDTKAPAVEEEPADPAPVEDTKAPVESDCTNGVDDDGDGLADCGDSDCALDPSCAPDGNPENTNARCSDWVDNDSDGHIDCDDHDCQGGTITACAGSWSGALEPTSAETSGASESLPSLGEGETTVDLIGRDGDVDGERNDMLCSDGVDNDGDGRTDCADFGCRFDPAVRVCHPSPGMRFSVVASITASYDLEEEKGDTRFSKLQLRTLGTIPGIQDSFYLISMRAEKTPRLTFAMFKVPIANGHFININSGGAGLSNMNVIGSQKQLLLDPPYALNSAFEQGNGASADFSGPLGSSGRFHYRTYLAGGSGLFSGNVGGRYFDFDDQNFTWGGGAQVQWNIAGSYSRWDNQFLYTPAQFTSALVLGGRYDQRAQERFPAMNAQFVLRWNRITFRTEAYYKRELEFESTQLSYYAQLGVLLWPKHLMVGADFGQFLPGKMNKPLAYDDMGTELRRQQETTLWRAAIHWFFWKNIGLASILYSDIESTSRDADAENPSSREREVRFVMQYRF